MKAPHLVSVFSTFTPAGPQLRIARLMRHLGTEFRYTIIAMDGCFDAAYALDPSLRVDLVQPPAGPRNLTYALTMYRMLAKLRPNLLATYNWGAMDAVMAGGFGRLCPVIHNEHGFGPDEAVRLKTKRVLMRRAVLPWIFTTIVPSRNLLRIAREQYRLPAGKVQFIASGVDTESLSPRAGERRTGAPVFGYVGHLRAEKNVELLLRAFAAGAIEDATLILVGDGNLRASLEQLASELRIAERVTFVGAVQDVRPWLARFDVFVLSSLTEQTPMSLLEAMACGLPAICPDVGDCASILGNPGAPEIVPPRDAGRLAESLRCLTDPASRERIGAKNRARAVELFSAARMYREYETVYRAALAQSGFQGE